MSDVVLLEGKEYVSARRASEETGYARDYIGQLARKGLIGAQRVGGLWYVSLESLKGYRANADSYTPVPPVQQPNDLDTIVSFDGKDYVSASRAAKLSGYNQDYIGQLARAGKILSRQVGNRWYVEKSGLLSHKAEKDSLLAAVQREAVGLPVRNVAAPTSGSEPYAPYFTYVQEVKKDLMPVLHREETKIETPTASVRRISPIEIKQPAGNAHVIDMRRTIAPAPTKRTVRSSGKTMRRATKVAALLTFVIVISYGLTSLKTNSRYTLNTTQITTVLDQTASALQSSAALESLITYVERLVSKEIRYTRPQ